MSEDHTETAPLVAVLEVTQWLALVLNDSAVWTMEWGTSNMARQDGVC